MKRHKVKQKTTHSSSYHEINQETFCDRDGDNMKQLIIKDPGTYFFTQNVEFHALHDGTPAIIFDTNNVIAGVPSWSA